MLTVIETDKLLALTFVTQLWDKFSLAWPWDDANQFPDCSGYALGYLGNESGYYVWAVWRTRRLVTCFLVPSGQSKYYLLTFSADYSSTVLDKVLNTVLELDLHSPIW